ncbi:hypothetical protein RMHFA_05558 [Roseomonas mucosa]|uniref:Uncharacterized protein n=1 Tax=Roseomonas mucosa TaxID=207340 RepID=A0A4Y1MYV0_9PROT|nr:hypothetical protein RADP37_05558 [Roseomonas mucosa]UZO97401.1 hypothetical protein RMHFA_05558 [Roseomonas mucosa]
MPLSIEKGCGGAADQGLGHLASGECRGRRLDPKPWRRKHRAAPFFGQQTRG